MAGLEVRFAARDARATSSRQCVTHHSKLLIGNSPLRPPRSCSRRYRPRRVRFIAGLARHSMRRLPARRGNRRHWAAISSEPISLSCGGAGVRVARRACLVLELHHLRCMQRDATQTAPRRIGADRDMPQKLGRNAAIMPAATLAIWARRSSIAASRAPCRPVDPESAGTAGATATGYARSPSARSRNVRVQILSVGSSISASVASM